jgi:Alkylmercury lyase
MKMDFDTTVKLNIYQTIAVTTRTPDVAAVAAALDASVAEVQAAFQRLYQKRLLVQEPGDPGKIRMAPPFSGIKTQHAVIAGGKTYYANCAWDAFGVAAALHQDADIESLCPDCGEGLFFQVRDAMPRPQACAVHFAVPAALWWRDIVYT